VGLAHYAEMLADPVFWIAMKNNVLFILCNLVIQVGGGTVLAALLDRGIRRFGTTMRTIIFAPLVLAPVAIGIMWAIILEPNFGLVRQLANGAGLPFPAQGILGNPDLAFGAIVAVGAWNYLGFMMTIMLAAMQGIPREVYEAAKLDGASGIQTFLFVTIPGVRSALVLCALIVIVGSFKTFDLVYVLTGAGPGNTTQVLGTYIVETAFDLFRPNYAAAMSVVVLIVAMLFGSLQVMTSRRRRS
jgi:raffinose/stachyose/melibiose transport system permease protein